MTAGRPASIQSVILGPCPGIQSCHVCVFLSPSFSWPPRESSPGPHSGSPPSARMTGERQRQEQDWIPAFGENDGGEGKGHSRCRACFSFAVILFPSFSWPPRESSPRPHSGFPPSARMTAGTEGRDVCLCELNGAGFPPDGLGDGKSHTITTPRTGVVCLGGLMRSAIHNPR